MAVSKDLLNWRKKQKRGKIMKPSTFKSIVSKGKKKGLSKDSAVKIAGKAYWKTAEAKHKKKKDSVQQEIKKYRSRR